jgi:hypothetical protein
MLRFNSLWVFEALLEIRNAAGDAAKRCDRLFDELSLSEPRV